MANRGASARDGRGQNNHNRWLDRAIDDAIGHEEIAPHRQRRRTAPPAPEPQPRRNVAAGRGAGRGGGGRGRGGGGRVAAPAADARLANLIPADFEENERAARRILGEDGDGEEEDDEEDDGERPAGRNMGRRRKRAEDRAQPWVPSAEERANPSSPGNFLLWLQARGMNVMYADNMRRLLAQTEHPQSILDFLRDKERSRLYIQAKSKSPYSALIYYKSIQVALTPQTDHPWAPMCDLPDEDRLFWNKYFVLASDDAITYAKERASKDIDIDLAAARAILATKMSTQESRWLKYSKANTLLSLYLNFWPLRDDCAGMRMAHSLAACAAHPNTNYIIVPEDYLTNDRGWSIYIQKAKTVGPRQKYGPLQRFIPTDADGATQNEMPFVLFGKCLREYIRRNNRNTAADPEHPFRVGPRESLPFDSSKLSKFLSDNARAYQIVNKESFINFNRRAWDNFYYEHDRGDMWPKVVLWSFHTAKASRDSYMRGDSKLGCGCGDNPAQPQLREGERAAQQAQAQAALAAQQAGYAH